MYRLYKQKDEQIQNDKCLDLINNLKLDANKTFIYELFLSVGRVA